MGLVVMGPERLNKADLLLLCEDLGIDVSKIKRTLHLVATIVALGASESEFLESCELIQERKKEVLERKENEKQESERKRLERKLEMKRLDLELKK